MHFFTLMGVFIVYTKEKLSQLVNYRPKTDRKPLFSISQSLSFSSSQRASVNSNSTINIKSESLTFELEGFQMRLKVFFCCQRKRWMILQ